MPRKKEKTHILNGRFHSCLLSWKRPDFSKNAWKMEENAKFPHILCLKCFTWYITYYYYYMIDIHITYHILLAPTHICHMGVDVVCDISTRLNKRRKKRTPATNIVWLALRTFACIHFTIVFFLIWNYSLAWMYKKKFRHFYKYDAHQCDLSVYFGRYRPKESRSVLICLWLIPSFNLCVFL